MICRRKGYPFKVGDAGQRHRGAHPAAADVRRGDRLLRGRQGLQRRRRAGARDGRRDTSYYMPYQYGNEANPRAHYNGTAVEILDELDEVAAFVAGLGTGGTLMGIGRRLKEADPETKIVAAEPMQGELVQGLRSLDDGFIPPIIDLSVLDRKIMVSNRDAIVWTQKLLHEEGLFAGVSAGAVAAICVRIAGELDERQRRLPRPRRRLEVPLLRRLHDARSQSSRASTRPSGGRSSGPASPAPPRTRSARAARRSKPALAGDRDRARVRRRARTHPGSRPSAGPRAAARPRRSGAAAGTASRRARSCGSRRDRRRRAGSRARRRPRP